LEEITAGRGLRIARHEQGFQPNALGSDGIGELPAMNAYFDLRTCPQRVPATNAITRRCRRGKQLKLPQEFGTNPGQHSYRFMTGTDQTVLLIEDEELIRMGTSAMLEDSGFRVLEAGNADEAKNIIADHPEIAVIITDVQMPGSMDGLQLTRMISHDHAHIPVLITSGRTGLPEARAHGAASYLSKPYTAHDIQQAVIDLMRRC
jgi:CheY-like chemotaxis protein